MRGAEGTGAAGDGAMQNSRNTGSGDVEGSGADKPATATTGSKSSSGWQETEARRKYYRPKSAEDKKRRDQERVLKNRELANISNAKRKRRIEQMVEENKSLKEEAQRLDEYNTHLHQQLQSLHQEIERAKASAAENSSQKELST
mmetsp:Transcript_12401/g.37844  ORF Transcript_12401/g.37844 Transcript_12401/m.37844 type:complete len:145 (-) Transcript_12401:416-850(-)